MSEATKRKIVTHEVVHGEVTISKNQYIVKVLESKGNNLFTVEDETSHVTMCSMPSKFRKNVWIKRGDYLIVEKIEEGKKVTCELVHILYPTQIMDLKLENEWPEAFQLRNDDKSSKRDDNKNFTEYRNPTTLSSDSEGSDADDSLEENVNQLNRPVIYLSESDDSGDAGEDE